MTMYPTDRQTLAFALLTFGVLLYAAYLVWRGT